MWVGCGVGVVEGSQMTAISVKIFPACLAHFKLHFCPLMAGDPIWWRMSGIWGEMLRWLWRNTCNSNWWGTLSQYLPNLSNRSKQNSPIQMFILPNSKLDWYILVSTLFAWKFSKQIEEAKQILVNIETRPLCNQSNNNTNQKIRKENVQV